MTISSLESSLESRKFSFASPVQEIEQLRRNASLETSMISSDKEEQRDKVAESSFNNISHDIQEESLHSNEQEQPKDDSKDSKKLETGFFGVPECVRKWVTPPPDKQEQNKVDMQGSKPPMFAPFAPLPQQEALNQSFRPKSVNVSKQGYITGGELADALDRHNKTIELMLQRKQITKQQADAEKSQTAQWIQNHYSLKW